MFVFGVKRTLFFKDVNTIAPFDPIAMSQAETTDEMSRIGPDEMSHVACTAMMDTSDLAPPQTNWVIDQAEQVEKRFIEYAENVEGVSCSDGRKRDSMTRYEERHGPELTADVSECDTATKKGVLNAAETLEQWFIETVENAGY
jgi:hypothetical protein